MLAVMVGAAHIHDSKSTVLLMRMLQYLLIPMQVILADAGYRGNHIAEIKARFGYIIQIVMRNNRNEKKFEPIQKDGLLNVLFPGLTTTEGYAGITSC